MQPRRNHEKSMDETFVTGAFAPRPSAQARQSHGFGLAMLCHAWML